MPGSPQMAPLLGVLLMVAAMFTVPLVDGIAKHLSVAYTVLFLAWARCFAGAFWSLPFGIAAYRTQPLDRVSLRLQVLRTVLWLVAMTLYYAAIVRVPMADALGAYFISPIAVTVLARLLLKEHLTMRRVGAVGLGFIGVLIVVKPGAQMDIGMLCAAASGITWAFYIIVTRKVNQNVAPTITLAFQYLLGAVLLTPWVLSTLALPTWQVASLIALMGLFSVISHALEIAALRYAQASVLAPWMYAEIASATLVGYMLFEELPSALTWLGIAIIIAAGLILCVERDKLVPATPLAALRNQEG